MSPRNILIRAGKSPDQVVSAEETLATNLMGSNSGNLLFSTAAFKLLSTPDATLTANGLGANPDDADRINEEYDCLVLPLANAFRPSFEPHLRRFTELVERLRIPVVVLSCGVQADIHGNFDRLAPINELVTRFMKAILERSAVVGVRGDFTATYLKQLGFNDVEVIGCPSMFLFGEHINVKKSRRLGPKDRIAINASTGIKRMGKVLMDHYERYPNLTYITQGKVDLQLLLWGDPYGDPQTSQFPVHHGHPLYRDNQVRFFLDPWTWMSYLRDYDFSFGTRIHGNIVALLAETPGFVLAHDSRTLELARYFEIPYRIISQTSDRIDARELYEEADYTGLMKNHRQRFARMVSFLEKNGLSHIYAYPGAAQKFDKKIDAVDFPPPVEPATADPHQLLDRLRWLRESHNRRLKSIEQRIARLEVAD